MLIMVYGTDQSDKLSMLDGAYLLKIDCTIRIFQSFVLG